MSHGHSEVGRVDQVLKTAEVAVDEVELKFVQVRCNSLAWMVIEYYQHNVVMDLVLSEANKIASECDLESSSIRDFRSREDDNHPSRYLGHS